MTKDCHKFNWSGTRLELICNNQTSVTVNIYLRSLNKSVISSTVIYINQAAKEVKISYSGTRSALIYKL